MPYWPVVAQSPQASSIQQLFWIVVGIAFVFLSVVEGGILWVLFRYRARAGPGEPAQIYGGRRIEFWWTIIPICILTAIFVLTVRAAQAQTTIPQDALPVTVIGHQWWWQIEYPTLGVSTANEIHLPAGRAIKFTMQSADVVHNFWFPTLGGKIQTVPGKTNIWTFTADQPGQYDGACSEFCGGAHAWMRLLLIAQSPADFDAWAAQQRQPAALAAAAAQEGARLFTQVACSQCHTIRGTAAGGTVGPDLTHVGSRETIGAGVAKNTLSDMAAWIHNAQAMKPSSYMPNLHLTDQQAAALARYMEDLK